MSDDRNPERDWPVINARQDVLEAQRILKAKPSPFAALTVQDLTQRWKNQTQLQLVKKDNNYDADVLRPSGS